MTDPFQPSPASRAYHEACEAEAARRADGRLKCAFCDGGSEHGLCIYETCTNHAECGTACSACEAREDAEAAEAAPLPASCEVCDRSTPADRAREAVRE